MGVWSAPFHDPDVARLFSAILAADTPMGASSAGKALWNVVGDDGFHDEVDFRKKAGDESDIRPNAVYWVEQWLAGDRSSWLKPFDDNAVAIVEAALASWHERHPVATVNWTHINPEDYFESSAPSRSMN